MRNSTVIQKILDSLNWDQIQNYHKKLNILWDIENRDGTKETRIPNVSDIKSELRELLVYVAEEKLDYLSYGNWLIFTDDTEYRVVFRLNDWVFTTKRDPNVEMFYSDSFKENSLDNKEELEEKLKSAIKVENYERAAEIRDAIHKIDKKD